MLRLRLILALLCAITLPGMASAQFHAGGVGSCQGCHIMHESEDGFIPASGPTGAWLMRGDTSSEVCLSCHADNQGEVLGADPLVPPPEYGGGKFIFLVEDNINDSADGLLNPLGGHAGGHNVVAPGYGLYADPDKNMSPGGSYPASVLGCTSCHDPHGNGQFRLLLDQGQQSSNGFLFTSPAPLAVGINLNASPEGPGNHTAYQQGWSAWCGNCHGQYHQQGSMNPFDHPSRRGLGGSQRNSYNSYDGTDNPTGGGFATAYLPELPLESISATIDQISGASAGDRLSCMTCHRAHATSAPSALRWDGNVTYLVDDGAISGSYAIPSPYASVGQRSLCEKCHWDDLQSDHANLSQPCLDCHGNPSFQN